VGIVVALLVGGYYWIYRTSVDPNRVSLYVAATIGAITTIYALFTYEILLQNQATAKAATDSANLSERALRFSYTENLIFYTVNTKDPTFEKLKGTISAIDSEDYQRALNERGDGQQQKEYVFAIVKNIGRGAATKLNLQVEYAITDSSSANRHYNVPKKSTTQVLEPNKAIALHIFSSNVPTPDDRVRLVSAQMTSSNFYRDALGEATQGIAIDVNQHQVECEPTCVVTVA
jgi:hypothetical protein